IRRRQLERRRLDRRILLRRRALAGLDHDRVAALAQPARAGLLHVARARARQPRQLLAEAAGVAVEDGAFGQHVGLAAEAADALDAADEAGADRGARALELLRARALRDQARDLLVDRRLDTLR